MSDEPIAINPRIDVVFHDLFGRAGNEDLLLALLHEVLAPSLPIQRVRLRDPYQLPEVVTDKLVIVDLEAVDTAGKVYHVEMQTTIDVGIQARVIYAWASIFRRQIDRGDAYQDLMPVISIWFCDRNVVRDAPSWHTAWKVRDETGKVWSDHLEVHIVELERWRCTRSGEARWVRFLAEAEQWTEVPEGLRDPLMEKAMHALQRFQYDDHARAVYEARVRDERRQLSIDRALEAERLRAEQAEAGRAEAEARLRAEREQAEARLHEEQSRREALAALLRAHGIAVPSEEG